MLGRRPLTLLLPSGSMYDGLADNYNNYGTANRSSYYSKFQAGPGSWAYPVRSAFPSKGPGVGGWRGRGRGSGHRPLRGGVRGEEAALLHGIGPGPCAWPRVTGGSQYTLLLGPVDVS